MMTAIDFLFGSRTGQALAGAVGLLALVAWWQIDRAVVRAAAKSEGQLEERVQTQEMVNDRIRKAGAARDLARDGSGRLLNDPFVRD